MCRSEEDLIMTTQVSNLSIFLSEYDYMGPNTMSNRIISGVVWLSIVCVPEHEVQL